jgi:hypothetical protein
MRAGEKERRRGTSKAGASLILRQGQQEMGVEPEPELWSGPGQGPMLVVGASALHASALRSCPGAWPSAAAYNLPELGPPTPQQMKDKLGTACRAFGGVSRSGRLGLPVSLSLSFDDLPTKAGSLGWGMALAHNHWSKYPSLHSCCP